MKNHQFVRGCAAAVALAGVVTLGSATAGAQVANAAPAQAYVGPAHTVPVPKINPEAVKSAVSWLYKTAVEGVVQWVVVEGIQSLNFSSSADPAAAAAQFWASVPTLSSSSVTTPDSLVSLAKLAPGSDLKNRTAFVKGVPDDLFSKITSNGCSRVSKTEAKCGLQTIRLSSGSKSSKPTITVSSGSFGSTKVVVLY